MTAVSYDKLRESDRKKVAEFVEGTAGIQMPASKASLMETRLRKRQKALGFDSLHVYINHTLSEPEGEAEKINLLDALTTNKTDFYREPEHFAFLRDFLLQHRSTIKQPLRIWSAGCSAGHEPYTLSMEMLELKKQWPRLQCNIMATDISLTCLKKAKRGVYSHDTIEPVPVAIRKQYLLRAADKNDPRICMGPEISRLVDFAYFNLLDDDFGQFRNQFNVIFCRNVMIYFCDADREYLTNRFYESLTPGGLLCIGHSEALIDPKHLFKKCKPTIYQKPGLNNE